MKRLYEPPRLTTLFDLNTVVGRSAVGKWRAIIEMIDGMGSAPYPPCEHYPIDERHAGTICAHCGATYWAGRWS